MGIFTCTMCKNWFMHFGNHNADSICCACKQHKHIPRKKRRKN